MKQHRAVLNEGVQHIAESKVQDALPKWEELDGQAVSWHFIGHLQTNKVKDVIGKFSYIHSLDPESLAREIEKRGKQRMRLQTVLFRSISQVRKQNMA